MSLIAGILTGIVGMASLTLYPVLILVGVMPITANATITVATVAAGVGTVLASLKELKNHWGQALSIAILSTVGDITGAVILIHSSNAGFKKIVPIFILLAGLLILWPMQKQKKHVTTLEIFVSYLSVILVGIYNGYFGAASGLLMIAILSRIVGGNYARYNAVRNLASFMGNLCSSLIFIKTLPIAWNTVFPLVVGLFIGGYLGPIVVRCIPSQLIKKGVGVFAIILAVILAVQTY